MALCESQLDSALPALKRDESPCEESQESPEKKPKLQPNGDIYGDIQAASRLPLSVDYRSPVSHFVPPELLAAQARPRSELQSSAAESSGTPTPIKRKRGRPRIDKTSPEYLANLAARKQAKEMVAVMNSNNEGGTPSGEKRKRGRPRVDKTSPEYLARKRARELEALEKKAKREHRRRTTGDSAASSSAGESTPRVKRKYTKRMPTKKSDAPTTERVKGKRGRPRKVDQLAANNKMAQQPKIRVRSNLMPINSEPITLDSDDEPDLGSPSHASDSLSLDENLRALRHIHEKYANLDKDDLYGAHLLAANFKKPADNRNNQDDEVLSVRSSEGNASVKEAETRVEKLEDSSNSDSDSSSSGSGSSSSGSSSSSSSGSSSSSDSSDSESEDETNKTEQNNVQHTNEEDSRSFGAWSYSGPQTDSGSDSDPERLLDPAALRAEQDEISESENESADKSFQCHICRKWYSTRVTLKIHRRGHQNRGGGNSRCRTRSSDRYECDCCTETFNRREKLWEHKASVHRGAMTVRCSVCRRCFEDEHELAAHDSTHTDDERAGRCSICPATFPRYDQLRRHAAWHAGSTGTGGATGASGERLPHACAQCGKRFGHAHSLTRHMHNHAKQLYRCVVCKASFARADQLAQHLNSHLANYKRLKP